MVTSFTYEQDCSLLLEYDNNNDPTKYQTINEWARENIGDPRVRLAYAWWQGSTKHIARRAAGLRALLELYHNHQTHYLLLYNWEVEETQKGENND